MSGLTSTSSEDPNEMKPTQPQEVFTRDTQSRDNSSRSEDHEASNREGENSRQDNLQSVNELTVNERSVVDSDRTQDASSATIQSLEVRENLIKSGNDAEEANGGTDQMGKGSLGEEGGRNKAELSPAFGGNCWQRCFGGKSK